MTEGACRYVRSDRPGQPRVVGRTRRAGAPTLRRRRSAAPRRLRPARPCLRAHGLRSGALDAGRVGAVGLRRRRRGRGRAGRRHRCRARLGRAVRAAGGRSRPPGRHPRRSRPRDAGTTHLPRRRHRPPDPVRHQLAGPVVDRRAAGARRQGSGRRLGPVVRALRIRRRGPRAAPAARRRGGEQPPHGTAGREAGGTHRTVHCDRRGAGRGSRGARPRGPRHLRQPQRPADARLLLGRGVRKERGGVRLVVPARGRLGLPGRGPARPRRAADRPGPGGVRRRGPRPRRADLVAARQRGPPPGR